MRYALDTEFIDDGKTIDLISIGIVAEDGRGYYSQSVEFNFDNASQWVKENVILPLSVCPHVRQGQHKYGQCVDQFEMVLPDCPWRTRKQLKRDIFTFMDIKKYGKPEIWGWCSGYDWVAFCQLFGTMMDIPTGYPHYIRDIQFLLDEKGLTDDMLPQQEGQQHNALEDARYIFTLLGFIRGYDI